MHGLAFDLDALVAEEIIVPFITVELIKPPAAAEQIVAEPAEEYVVVLSRRFVRRQIGRERRITFSEGETVRRVEFSFLSLLGRGPHTVQFVVSGAGVEIIAPVPTEQQVDLRTAEEKVVSFAA